MYVFIEAGGVVSATPAQKVQLVYICCSTHAEAIAYLVLNNLAWSTFNSS